MALTDDLLSRVAIGIDRLLCPVVGDFNVVQDIVSSWFSRGARNLAIFESQALRKASDLDVSRGHALWEALDLLRNINRAILLVQSCRIKRSISDGHRQGVLLLDNLGLFTVCSRQGDGLSHRHHESSRLGRGAGKSSVLSQGQTIRKVFRGELCSRTFRKLFLNLVLVLIANGARLDRLRGHNNGVRRDNIAIDFKFYTKSLRLLDIFRNIERALLSTCGIGQAIASLKLTTTLVTPHDANRIVLVEHTGYINVSLLTGQSNTASVLTVKLYDTNLIDETNRDRQVRVVPARSAKRVPYRTRSLLVQGLEEVRAMGTVGRLPVTFRVLNKLVGVLQRLLVFSIEVGTVVTVFVRLINDRLSDVLIAVGLILEQFTDLIRTHVRTLTVELLHSLEAFIGQDRGNDLVPLNESLTCGIRETNVTRVLLRLQPYASLNVVLVRIFTAIRSDVIAISVNLPVGGISRHVRCGRFNHFKSSTGHVLACQAKCTVRLVAGRTVEPGEATRPLVDLLQRLTCTASLTLGKPNTCLCSHTIGVNLTVFIGPRTRRKSKRTGARRSAVTAIVQEVSLC